MLSHRISQLTTQFMLLCWGASALSLVPIPWRRLPLQLSGALEQLRPTLPLSAFPAGSPPSPSDVVVTDLNPMLPISRAQSGLQVINIPEIHWANLWYYRGHTQPVATPEKPAAEAILAKNRSTLAAEPELIVDLSDRSLYFYKGETLQKRYPIAIGQSGWETPLGVFSVTQKKKNPAWKHPITGTIVPAGADNPLGLAWIGFWHNDGYEIGFHGTSEASELGQAISHGCVRLLNDDILELFEQVETGWVVTVRP